MTFPPINHPEGGIPALTPQWAEELIELTKHQLAAQNQTNQLLQQLVDAQAGHSNSFAEIMERAIKRSERAHGEGAQGD